MKNKFLRWSICFHAALNEKTLLYNGCFVIL